MKKQIKSKKRVTNYGEVFTAEREVNAMLDLVKPETEKPESRFLEPACGTGNFTVEILRRKLNAAESSGDFLKQSLISVASIYGIELLRDNADTCRKRMFDLWDKKYAEFYGHPADFGLQELVRYIIEQNIVCGDTLKMMYVDENRNATGEYIEFVEWAFENGIQQRRCRFDKMVGT